MKSIMKAIAAISLLICAEIRKKYTITDSMKPIRRKTPIRQSNCFIILFTYFLFGVSLYRRKPHIMKSIMKATIDTC